MHDSVMERDLAFHKPVDRCDVQSAPRVPYTSSARKVQREEVINALANVDGLRVVSRTSAFAYKNKNLSVRQIGEELAVATVLEGSVRREGNALRLTAQLINAADGYHL